MKGKQAGTGMKVGWNRDEEAGTGMKERTGWNLDEWEAGCMEQREKGRKKDAG